MQNTTLAEATTHRQLLKYCRVRNHHGICTERFIDHQTFSLWQFLMQHKHHFSITHTEPCVWIPQQQWLVSEHLFDSAPLKIPVSRLEFECYDAASGVTELRTRFVRETENANLSTLLLQHLCGEDEIATLRSEPGMTISTNKTIRPEPSLGSHTKADGAYEFV